MARRYETPMAFKAALEHRLRRRATRVRRSLNRERQLLVFDRFLARVFEVMGDDVVLKGGLVVELRLARARTTKDIDLRLLGQPDHLLSRLQEAGRASFGDFMTFEVGPSLLVEPPLTASTPRQMEACSHGVASK
ncbi:MAG: nucleotidyl transferase AbiEii/AbiGii toxin family protein [Myxococcota bacterium]